MHTFVWLSIGFLLFFFLFRLLKKVKQHGLTNCLQNLFQGCGDICYGPRWIKKSLESFAYEDEYDKEKDKHEWKRDRGVPLCPRCDPSEELHYPWCKNVQ